MNSDLPPPPVPPESAVGEETPPPPPANLGPLDRKIVDAFPGLVVRKDITKGLRQNAVVPSYVLEYLLGQHCATDDEATIRTGLEAVKRILSRHYVHRNESELTKSIIKEKGRHKVIDKVTVELNDKGGFYEAEFTNLGLKKVPVPDDFVRRHPKLLVGGIWCITEITYEVNEDAKSSPWHIDSLKPIQVSKVDYGEYLKARATFTTDEWIDTLIQSIGFNPEMLTRRAKLLQLLRFVPFCERNYNLLELGPKGTGKSHVYAEFSPHGMLISGSEVTAPKLFVSNSSGKIGLVGFWDCVCFDEFAGKDKKVDKALVDIMKNYMANRSFSRGIEQLTAEASMVFMGNTKKSVAYMLKHSHFFEQLPDKYIDSAFLDRLHAFSPGWEVAPIRNDLFTSGYGFIVDYYAEILKHQRSEDFTNAYKADFEITSELSTRDQTGLEKTFSGMMKILYPQGGATADEIEELLAFSMECRRRVREHILRIDDTFKPHDFTYRRKAGGESKNVLTPEEVQYPEFSKTKRDQPNEESVEGEGLTAKTETGQPSIAGVEGRSATPKVEPAPGPQARHLVIPENSKGWSYRRLFADHLRGARKITVRDPYVRAFHQVRNFMEFLELVHDLVPEGDEVEVQLFTQSDLDTCVKQDENLKQLEQSFTGSRVAFSWELDHNPNFHARSINTDHGWKITIDRGLDIFQRFETGPFSLEQAMQETRLTKGAEVNYVRLE
ncbi:MAG: BREX system Lon protease-like protein BrxL [Casimicrobiaceae bacterium]